MAPLKTQPTRVQPRRGGGRSNAEMYRDTSAIGEALDRSAPRSGSVASEMEGVEQQNRTLSPTESFEQSSGPANMELVRRTEGTIGLRPDAMELDAEHALSRQAGAHLLPEELPHQNNQGPDLFASMQSSIQGLNIHSAAYFEKAKQVQDSVQQLAAGSVDLLRHDHETSTNLLAGQAAAGFEIASRGLQALSEVKDGSLQVLGKAHGELQTLSQVSMATLQEARSTQLGTRQIFAQQSELMKLTKALLQDSHQRAADSARSRMEADAANDAKLKAVQDELAKLHSAVETFTAGAVDATSSRAASDQAILDGLGRLHQLTEKNLQVQAETREQSVRGAGGMLDHAKRIEGAVGLIEQALHKTSQQRDAHGAATAPTKDQETSGVERLARTENEMPNPTNVLDDIDAKIAIRKKQAELDKLEAEARTSKIAKLKEEIELRKLEAKLKELDGEVVAPATLDAKGEAAPKQSTRGVTPVASSSGRPSVASRAETPSTPTPSRTFTYNDSPASSARYTPSRPFQPAKRPTYSGPARKLTYVEESDTFTRSKWTRLDVPAEEIERAVDLGAKHFPDGHVSMPPNTDLNRVSEYWSQRTLEEANRHGGEKLLSNQWQLLKVRPEDEDRALALCEGSIVKKLTDNKGKELFKACPNSNLIVAREFWTEGLEKDYELERGRYERSRGAGQLEERSRSPSSIHM